MNNIVQKNEIYSQKNSTGLPYTYTDVRAHNNTPINSVNVNNVFRQLRDNDLYNEGELYNLSQYQTGPKDKDSAGSNTIDGYKTWNIDGENVEILRKINKPIQQTIKKDSAFTGEVRWVLSFLGAYYVSFNGGFETSETLGKGWKSVSGLQSGVTVWKYLKWTDDIVYLACSDGVYTLIENDSEKSGETKYKMFKISYSDINATTLNIDLEGKYMYIGAKTGQTVSIYRAYLPEKFEYFLTDYKLKFNQLYSYQQSGDIVNDFGFRTKTSEFSAGNDIIASTTSKVLESKISSSLKNRYDIGFPVSGCKDFIFQEYGGKIFFGTDKGLFQLSFSSEGTPESITQINGYSKVTGLSICDGKLYVLDTTNKKLSSIQNVNGNLNSTVEISNLESNIVSGHVIRYNDAVLLIYCTSSSLNYYIKTDENLSFVGSYNAVSGISGIDNLQVKNSDGVVVVYFSNQIRLYVYQIDTKYGKIYSNKSNVNILQLERVDTINESDYDQTHPFMDVFSGKNNQPIYIRNHAGLGCRITGGVIKTFSNKYAVQRRNVDDSNVSGDCLVVFQDGIKIIDTRTGSVYNLILVGGDLISNEKYIDAIILNGNLYIAVSSSGKYIIKSYKCDQINRFIFQNQHEKEISGTLLNPGFSVYGEDLIFIYQIRDDSNNQSSFIQKFTEEYQIGIKRFGDQEQVKGICDIQMSENSDNSIHVTMTENSLTFRKKTKDEDGEFSYNNVDYSPSIACETGFKHILIEGINNEILLVDYNQGEEKYNIYVYSFSDSNPIVTNQNINITGLTKSQCGEIKQFTRVDGKYILFTDTNVYDLCDYRSKSSPIEFAYSSDTSSVYKKYGFVSNAVGTAQNCYGVINFLSMDDGKESNIYMNVTSGEKLRLSDIETISKGYEHFIYDGKLFLWDDSCIVYMTSGSSGDVCFSYGCPTLKRDSVSHFLRTKQSGVKCDASILYIDGSSSVQIVDLENSSTYSYVTFQVDKTGVLNNPSKSSSLMFGYGEDDRYLAFVDGNSIVVATTTWQDTEEKFKLIKKAKVSLYDTQKNGITIDKFVLTSIGYSTTGKNYQVVFKANGNIYSLNITESDEDKEITITDQYLFIDIGRRRFQEKEGVSITLDTVNSGDGDFRIIVSSTDSGVQSCIYQKNTRILKDLNSSTEIDGRRVEVCNTGGVFAFLYSPNGSSKPSVIYDQTRTPVSLYKYNSTDKKIERFVVDNLFDLGAIWNSSNEIYKQSSWNGLYSYMANGSSGNFYGTNTIEDIIITTRNDSCKILTGGNSGTCKFQPYSNQLILASFGSDIGMYKSESDGYRSICNTTMEKISFIGSVDPDYQEWWNAGTTDGVCIIADGKTNVVSQCEIATKYEDAVKVQYNSQEFTYIGYIEDRGSLKFYNQNGFFGIGTLTRTGATLNEDKSMDSYKSSKYVHGNSIPMYYKNGVWSVYDTTGRYTIKIEGTPENMKRYLLIDGLIYVISNGGTYRSHQKITQISNFTKKNDSIEKKILRMVQDDRSPSLNFIYENNGMKRCGYFNYYNPNSFTDLKFNGVSDQNENGCDEIIFFGGSENRIVINGTGDDKTTWFSNGGIYKQWEGSSVKTLGTEYGFYSGGRFYNVDKSGNVIIFDGYTEKSTTFTEITSGSERINFRKILDVGNNTFIIESDKDLYYVKNSAFRINNSGNKIHSLQYFTFDGDNYKYMFSIGNSVYMCKNYKKYFKLDDNLLFSLQDSGNEIYDVYPRNDKEYVMATNNGLYYTEYKYDLFNDIERFGVDDVYSLYMDMVPGLQKELDDRIESHTEDYHNSQSLIPYLNEFIEDIDYSLTPFEWRRKQEEKTGGVVTKLSASNDVLAEVDFGRKGEDNIDVTTSNFVDQNYKPDFRYISKKYYSGICELYLYIDSTKTYYINHTPDTGLVEYYDDLSYKRRNLEFLGSEKATIKSDIWNHRTEISVQISLEDGGFKINNDDFTYVDIQGNSLPLKIYLDVDQETNKDTMISGLFQSRIEDSHVWNVSKTDDDSLLIKARCFGSDSQAMKITYYDPSYTGGYDKINILFHGGNGGKIEGEYIDGEERTVFSQKANVNGEVYLRRNKFVSYIEGTNVRKIFRGWSYKETADNLEPDLQDRQLVSISELFSGANMGIEKAGRTVNLYAVWLQYEFSENDTTLLLNSDLSEFSIDKVYLDPASKYSYLENNVILNFN